MNMNWDAAFAACKSYEEAEVSAALQAAIDAAGGLDWVTPGMRVALKLNLVSAMKPEQAATVHPAGVCALVRMLTARGAHVILGDSPGGLYTSAHLQRVYDATGLRAAEALGAELNEDFSVCTVSYPEALQARSFTMTAYLQQADAIIDVCKLKTHGMMGMTNAVKNFFGIIPGTMKPEYHYKYPKVSDFADMLVDLCEYCRPRLCICDAVVGMEGNGPTQGSARSIGCLIAAQSAHKLDLAACGRIGLTPGEVPTLTAAIRRGLCPEALALFGQGKVIAHIDEQRAAELVFQRGNAEAQRLPRQIQPPGRAGIVQVLTQGQKIAQLLNGHGRFLSRNKTQVFLDTYRDIITSFSLVVNVILLTRMAKHFCHSGTKHEEKEEKGTLLWKRSPAKAF